MGGDIILYLQCSQFVIIFLDFKIKPNSYLLIQ